MKKLIIAFLFACNAEMIPVSNEYILYIDDRFTIDQQDDIIQASINWQNNTNVIIHPYISNVDCNKVDGNFVMCFHPSTKEYVSSRHEHAGAITIIHPGFQSTNNTYIAMDTSIMSSYPGRAVSKILFRAVATHEMGHQMGLDHQTTFGIMSPITSIDTSTINCSDVKQYNDLRNMTTDCKD